MKACGLTDTGLCREDNQDSIFHSAQEDFPLFIVADGMGGHNAGRIASSMAVDIIKENFIKNKENLASRDDIIACITESIHQANEEIYNQALSIPQYAGMGTTLTMAYIFEDRIYIGHVGDSRAYYIDASGMKQVTEDDSLVNELVKNGSISEEEALIHPKRNIITKALGTYMELDFELKILGYRPGDYFLICSDGLTNMVRDNTIFDIISNEEEVELACNKLVQLANDNGGKDNITVIIVEL